MRILPVFLTLAFLFGPSCIKRTKVGHAGLSPEQVVQAFVDLSVLAKDMQDKNRLEQVCVGEMRRTFQRMNEDAFRLIYLDSKLKLVKFNVLEKEVGPDSARVTYQVTVQNDQGTDPTKETNSREVDLIQSEGVWYIDNIRIKGTDDVAFTRGMIF